MSDWPLFASGVAVGSILTAAALFYSVEIRLRGLRLQMEKELEELRECVQRAKAGKRMSPENDPRFVASVCLLCGYRTEDPKEIHDPSCRRCGTKYVAYTLE